jgi:hypothetical protein
MASMGMSALALGPFYALRAQEKNAFFFLGRKGLFAFDQ